MKIEILQLYWAAVSTGIVRMLWHIQNDNETTEHFQHKIIALLASGERSLLKGLK